MLAARFLKSSSQQANNAQGNANYGYGTYRGYGSYGGYSNYGSYSGDSASRNYNTPDNSDYGSYSGDGDTGSVRPARVDTSGYAAGSEGTYEGGYGDSAYGDTGTSTGANSGSSTEVP